MKRAWLVVFLSFAIAEQLSAQGFNSRPLPPLVFWENTMGVDSNLALQVNDYVNRHDLKPLPLRIDEHFRSRASFDGADVYTLDQGDIVCGVPAGAIAYAAIGLADESDLKKVPHFQELLSAKKTAEVRARKVAKNSTRLQMEMLKAEQGGKVSASQDMTGKTYRAMLEDSLTKNLTEADRVAILSEYASIVNTGFNKLSLQDKCIWAAGVLVLKESNSLDARIAAGKKQSVQSSRNTALGFDSSASVRSSLDEVTLVNTLKAAKALQSKAFSLGVGG